MPVHVSGHVSGLQSHRNPVGTKRVESGWSSHGDVMFVEEFTYLLWELSPPWDQCHFRNEQFKHPSLAIVLEAFAKE